eukprot:scaffold57788_cov17-Tisochrysis_lutea.AAC.1
MSAPPTGPPPWQCEVSPKTQSGRTKREVKIFAHLVFPRTFKSQGTHSECSPLHLHIHGCLGTSKATWARDSSMLGGMRLLPHGAERQGNALSVCDSKKKARRSPSTSRMLLLTLMASQGHGANSRPPFRALHGCVPNFCALCRACAGRLVVRHGTAGQSYKKDALRFEHNASKRNERLPDRRAKSALRP